MSPETEIVVIVVYVPHSDADAVRAALAEAGAGAIGDYRGCSWSTSGHGRFTPVEGANPTIGGIGVEEVVPEDRIEVVAPRAEARGILRAMVDAHPYEEPAHHVIPVLSAAELP
ncbi:MAG: hypothetical protein Q4F53_04510 [Nesterenkonia sp.]|uniref:hypothetical protein n=1 Tax=Nesterenkonia marinintestina TaxID=2979865 RepID=UPI0021C048FA|nr:hypothetical protein [Nesterenkonia sp. GX14115]MDO5492856.1 hypothetical protein [Nesterenkonia sp.]